MGWGEVFVRLNFKGRFDLYFRRIVDLSKLFNVLDFRFFISKIERVVVVFCGCYGG